MNDTRTSGRDVTVKIVLIMVFVFLVLGAIGVWRAVELIGGGALTSIATVFVVFLGLAMLAWGVSHPIKAWRTPIKPPPEIERHFHHDGARVIEKHTIDGRAVVQSPYPALPAPGSNGVYPSLMYQNLQQSLGAGYAAGQASAHQGDEGYEYAPPPEQMEAEYNRLRAQHEYGVRESQGYGAEAYEDGAPPGWYGDR